MPGYDKSGPMGQGPMSGRAMGRCGGAEEDNFASGRGYGMARGGRGRRCGRGGRGGRGGWGYGPNYSPEVANNQDLRAEADFLRGRLNAIEQRLSQEENASD